MKAENHIKQVEQRIIQEQRRKRKQEIHAVKEQERINNARDFIVGKCFIKHFPIVKEFPTADDWKSYYELLDKFIGALSECQQAYEAVEKALIQK